MSKLLTNTLHLKKPILIELIPLIHSWLDQIQQMGHTFLQIQKVFNIILTVYRYTRVKDENLPLRSGIVL